MLGMTRYLVLLFALAASACSSKKAAAGVAALPQKLQYPTTRTVDHVDSSHGIDVADPSRWLENEPSDETQSWLATQAAITERFFAEVPEHAEARASLEANWIEGVIGIAQKKGDNTFFWQSAEGQNHPVLYVRKG